MALLSDAETKKEGIKCWKVPVKKQFWLAVLNQATAERIDTAAQQK
jgi:hypothetical protein